MSEHDDRRQANIDKIAALLRKAEDKGCTPEESEAFFAKAQALMTKWSIDEMMLQRAGGNVKAEEIKQVTIKIPSTYYSALVHLWNEIAKANDCSILINKRACVVYLMGYESDLAQVQMLVTSLQIFAQREAAKGSPAGSEGYYFRRSFIQSFAFRIGARLREQRDLNVKEAETAGTPGVGLALLDKRKQVTTWMHQHHNVGRSRGGQQRTSHAGASAGTAAANRADLGNRRVSGSRGVLGS